MTYMIENSNSKVLGYYTRLNDAKDFVIALGAPFNCYRIVAMRGPYKFEGFHAYYMRYNGKSFYYDKGNI